MSAKFLAGKAAVVTGGTRGIGRAIAGRLLAEGARVAICGSRQKSVDDAVEALHPHGEVFGMVADVSRIDDVRRFAAAITERFGGLQILVNSAGAGLFRSVGELAPDDWNRIIGLNLTGVYHCCHELLPALRVHGSGDVINISSLAGKNAFAGGAAYNASKFGLNGFSEALMMDYRNDGIRVTTIMPGSVDTAFGGSLDAGSETNAWKIAPEDIAETVICALSMPRRTTVSEIQIRPSKPSVKK